MTDLADGIRMLTIRQPWAWAVAVGAKGVENRSQGVSYRGPLAIHAGLALSDRGVGDERVWELWGRYHLPYGYDGLPRGVVVAVADLVDCHPDGGCCRPWGESEYREAGGRVRTGIWHWVLEDVRRLPEPLPARGGQGLRRVPPDLAAALAPYHAAGAA